MVTIMEIRKGLAAAMAGIEGLHAFDVVPDSVTPPAAVVYGPEIDYDATMRGGSDDYRFWVILLTSRSSVRSGQEQLDTYLVPSGATSVKAAIEGNEDLGGIVDFARVKSVSEYETREVGATTYFAAALLVEVTVSGVTA